MARDESEETPGNTEAHRERLADKDRASDRYERKDEIARGGMGAIFEVVDLELRRQLAMKVAIGTGHSDGSVDTETSEVIAERFLEEAQITAQLDHPGVVPVHELGLDEEGQVFFTMKLVKGRDLKAIFELVHGEKEGWNRPRALGVLLRVCEAMAYAHHKGVIHRDLKPANIMVGRYGEVYVMDWGLARVEGLEDTHDLRVDSGDLSILRTDRAEVRESDTGSPLVTLDGAVIGTPYYMPPEQARGDLGALSPRSDVYAVGAMLYHLLAGHMPYQEGGKVTPQGVLLQVLERAPRPIAELAHDASPELVAICEKAMARRPGERYPDMATLGDDLRAYLEGRVVRAYGGGAVAELRKWIRRNPALAGSLAAIVLLAIVSLAVILWIQTGANRELKDLNRDLANQTTLARQAGDEARQNELLALVNERTARWSSYVANIAAASAGLDGGAAQDAAENLESCEEELRGWEWRHLRNRADTSLASVEVSEAFVFAVAYSPTGEYLATGTGHVGDIGLGEIGIQLWRADTLEHVRTLSSEVVSLENLRTSRSSVLDLEFSPSGTELVSTHSDGRVLLWDVERGESFELEWVENPDPGFGTSCRGAYHPDGLHLALGWSDGRIALWSALSSKAVFDQRVGSAVGAVAVSPDGELLCAGLASGEVQVFSLSDASRVATIDLSALTAASTAYLTSGVTDVEFSADGSELLIALDSGAVVVQPLVGERRLLLDGHARRASSARYHPNGRWIVTSSFDGTIRFWSAEDGVPLETLHGHTGNVARIALSPSGHRIVSGSHDTTTRLWDGQPGSSTIALHGLAQSSSDQYDAVFSPDGSRLAWRSAPGTVRVTDARTGLDLFTLPSSDQVRRGMGFSSDGKLLYTLPDRCRLQVWDAETGEHLRSVGDALVIGGEVHFGRDAERFVAWTDGAVRVWSTATGEELASREAAYAERALLRHDGGQVVYNAPDGAIFVWDLESDEIVHRFEMPERECWLALGPTGRYLAAATYDVWDNAVWLFDLVGGGLVRKLEGHAQPYDLAWMPDGSRIVSGNWDGTVSLWDPVRGEVASLRSHRENLWKVAVSPDGTRIASGESGGRYVIHDTTPVSERAELRRAAALDRRLEPRARELVAALFERLLLPDLVVRQLEQDEALDSALRATAIRLARNHGWTAGDTEFWTLNMHLWDAERAPDELVATLRAAKTHVEVTAGPSTPSVGTKVLLASAQLRMGLAEEAKTTLTTALAETRKVGRDAGSFGALIVLFRALAEALQGRDEEARRDLELVRALRPPEGPTATWLDAMRARIELEIEKE